MPTSCEATARIVTAATTNKARLAWAPRSAGSAQLNQNHVTTPARRSGTSAKGLMRVSPSLVPLVCSLRSRHRQGFMVPQGTRTMTSSCLVLDRLEANSDRRLSVHNEGDDLPRLNANQEASA
jgi:hypothetical protein